MTESAQPSGPSRRTVLVGAAAVAALAGTGSLVPGTAARAVGTAAVSPFATVRSQWLATLIGDVDLGDPVVARYVADLAAAAAPVWDALDTGTGRTYLWADLDSSSTSALQTTAIGRLRTLALALKTPGSALTGDATLAADLVSAFDWFLANKYGGGVRRYDNWWDFQIGIPLALNDVCLLLHDQLSAAQIDTGMTAIRKYAPDPRVTAEMTSTGANRNWACSIAIVRGALSEDGAVIADAKNAYAPVFDYATSGDGFYPDGGFVQHEYHPYNGSYGFSLLQYLTYSMLAVRGTQWSFTAARLDRVVDWVEDNFRPWIHAGAFMDMTRGRALSRFYQTDHRLGHLTVATLVQLADVLPTSDAAALRSVCKGWIAADTTQPYFAYDDVPIEQVRIPSIVRGRALVADAAVPTAAESTRSVVATSMARAVHRRPGFALGIAMDSTTIKPYETANDENLQGWYTGEGATYLYLPGKPGHWANQYWPTADKYRIPGTTVQVKPLALGAGRGSTNTWTGGVVQDDVSVVGMGLSFAKQTLRARKSWFGFGDVVLHLGAGITSSDGVRVETVVEQRNTGLDGQTVPVVDGRAALTTPSSTATTLTPRWVHVPGTGGYVFPAGTAVRALREDRSGRWTDMDHRGTYEDDTTRTRRFVTLWLDHGVDPTDATYSWLQLPGATQAQVSAAAASDDVVVLANTASLQAARQISTGVTALTAWASGTPAIGGSRIDRTGCVVVRRDSDGVVVSVSEPTQRLTGVVTITVDGPAGALRSVDPRITVRSTSPDLVLTVDVSGAAGRTATARFDAA
ncbi:polysaccharide lyase 8 family protein [Curtobacterium sp. MCPF17_050]|uniref:polysaccharide lyase 8 family protein n=1 Tax=Curtobacterium sp. MCPF17_050 TaxID=2175664 RepID=UPI000D8D158E|nr:polysaccharide lyase 8 family protein [Curtobacterium sp. MCPF17_050]WIB16615.1 polysaccharide lyase 8 family protein [Curtobacterium sp. MCPF17_050]